MKRPTRITRIARSGAKKRKSAVTKLTSNVTSTGPVSVARRSAASTARRRTMESVRRGAASAVVTGRSAATVQRNSHSAAAQMHVAGRHKRAASTLVGGVFVVTPASFAHSTAAAAWQSKGLRQSHVVAKGGQPGATPIRPLSPDLSDCAVRGCAASRIVAIWQGITRKRSAERVSLCTRRGVGARRGSPLATGSV